MSRDRRRGPRESRRLPRWSEIAPLLEPLLAAGTDPWRVWGWLTQPAALLGGQVPAEAAADPETAQVAAHAARRLAAAG